MDGWMGGKMGGFGMFVMDGWIDGRGLDGWMDRWEGFGWMDGWIDGRGLEVWLGWMDNC